MNKINYSAKKKIFIALRVSENLAAEILKWQKSHGDFPVRWVKEKNLHITLIPPFYVDDEEIGKIKQILEKFQNYVGKVELEFKSVDFGFDINNPRLIWITGEAPQKIRNLRSDLENALREKSEYGDFLLHITIARFKPEEFDNFLVKKINEKIAWKGEVGKLVLMESKLFRQGADYEILESVDL